MDVFIRELGKTNSLYLYDPISNDERSEPFIKIFSDNGLTELSSSEQIQFDTNVRYSISANDFNRWVYLLKRQQDILDKIIDMDIDKSKIPTLAGYKLV